jgi:hypothetical protein
MRNRVVLYIILLFTICSSVFANNQNLLRVTTSQSTSTVGTFSLKGLSDPTEWVVFSVGGKLRLNGASSIIGLTGTNAVSLVNGERPVYFDWASYIATPSTLFYIGSGAVAGDIITYPDGWEYGIPEQRELKSLILEGKVRKLSGSKNFPVPPCLQSLSFQAIYSEAVKVDSMFSNIEKVENSLSFILSSGNFGRISLGRNQTVKVIVGSRDIVLNIGELLFEQSGQIVIEKVSPSSPGRVFFIVGRLISDGSAQIRTYDDRDDYVFFLHKGGENITFVSSSRFTGTFYSEKNIAATFTGTGVFKDILSLQGTITIHSYNSKVSRITGKTSNIFVDDSQLQTGILSGGSRVTVSGGVPTFQYIYAPSATILIDNNSGTNGKPASYDTVKGTVVGKEVVLINSRVVGPAYTPIPPSCPLIEVPIVESEVYVEPTSCGKGGWYNETSGQICQEDPVTRVQSGPVIVGVSSASYYGQKEVKNNPNERVMTWQAPYIEFISPLSLSTSFNLRSHFFIFNNNVTIPRNDVQLKLSSIGETAVVVFRMVYRDSTMKQPLTISNKAFKFSKELIITQNTTVQNLLAQGAEEYVGVIVGEIFK